MMRWACAALAALACSQLSAALPPEPTRELAVAARRLTKGSEVTCADIAVERRNLRWAPKQPLALPCAIPTGSVMLHHLARGDALRRDDIGPALDVTAGSPVRLSVS